MSKPTPKQNFLQTALIMLCIYMAFTLFFGQKAPKETRTPQQLFQQITTDSQHLMDDTMASDVKTYTGLLDDMVQQKKLSPQQADAKKIEATIMLANTQFEDGLFKNDTNRVRNAYFTLASYQKKLVDKPEWNTSYPVPKPIIKAPYSESSFPNPDSVTKFPWQAWSGQALYAKVVQTLTDRNRTEYVWGFIPGYALMDFLVHLTGAQPAFSYAFAAFLLAFLVRASVFGLMQKQLLHGRQMSQLVPLTNEIKQKYKNDQAEQQRKVMELYREYGINPLAGCVPALIQTPLFIAIYQCMLKYQFAFQHGTFLWINPITSKASNGVIAPNLGQQDYILIIIYGITMVTSTLLTPVTDPSQIKMQRGMGVGMAVLFTFFMFTGAMPIVAGFVLYWTFTNILATAQSLRAYRMPLPPLVKVNAQGGGVLPKPASRWQLMMDKLMDEQKKAAERNGSTSQSPTVAAEEKNGGAKAIGAGSMEQKKTGTPAKHKPKKRK